MCPSSRSSPLAAEPEQGFGHLLHGQRRAADALQGMRGGRAAGLVEQLQVHADHRQRVRSSWLA